MADVEDYHRIVLQGRFDYLGARIEAKKMVGLDTLYDERERAALDWALDKLWSEPAEPQAVVQGDDCP